MSLILAFAAELMDKFACEPEPGQTANSNRIPVLSMGKETRVINTRVRMIE